jgi:hypothetical protein
VVQHVSLTFDRVNARRTRRNAARCDHVLVG